MLSRFAQFSELIDKLIVRIGYAVTWLFFLIVLIGFYEVMMRYVFDSPTFWVHETTTFIVSIGLLYGGVYCYADDRHIAMTFLVDSLDPKTRWYFDMVVHLLVFVFTLMMLYGAYLNAKDAFFSYSGELKLQTSGSAWDTPFPAYNKGFFFVSCIILSILSVLHNLRHLANFSKIMNAEEGDS